MSTPKSKHLDPDPAPTPAVDPLANRPSVEWLSGLFPKFGLVPDPSRFIGVHHETGLACGCLVTCLLAEASGGLAAARATILTTRGWFRDVAGTANGLPSDYVVGLMWGFALGGANRCHPDYDVCKYAGYEDGSAVRRIVMPVMPAKPEGGR